MSTAFPLSSLLPFQFSNTWLATLYSTFSLSNSGMVPVTWLDPNWYTLIQHIYSSVLIWFWFCFSSMFSPQAKWAVTPPLILQDSSHVSLMKTSAPTILSLWTPTVSLPREATTSVECTLARAQKAWFKNQLCYSLGLSEIQISYLYKATLA